MEVGAVIQARMSSKRCPGKVLKMIAGKPALQYLVERVRRCRGLSGIVVATSTEQMDSPIIDFCGRLGVSCFQGPLENVARRFSEVLQEKKYPAFLRVNADAPLLDPHLIDHGINLFRKQDVDIVTNVLKRTFPKGQSVEILKSALFIETERSLITSPEDQEHVTTYFYKHARDFRIHNFSSGGDHGNIQLGVDTPQDFDLLCQLVNRMKKEHWQYTWEELLRLKEEVLDHDGRIPR
jgi:spore coat polysaccharide biosynthesis protein SpsF